MKTTNTHKAFLESLIKNQDFYDYNAVQISTLERLKPNEPFSHRLNDFTTSWFKKNESLFLFSQEDDFDPSNLKGTLQKYTERYRLTGKIVVNSQNCEGSIYSNEQINLYGRCIHEYYHVVFSLPYNGFGETMASIMHSNMLPKDFLFEKSLITADILGQFLYYSVHREYVIYPRKFCTDFLRNPYSIFTKQQV